MQIILKPTTLYEFGVFSNYHEKFPKKKKRIKNIMNIKIFFTKNK